MKFPQYYFFIALLGLIFSSPNLAFSQETEVPANLRAQFIAENPGADNANWQKEEDGSFECAFTMDGMERGIVYGVGGEVLARQAALKESDLPAAIQDYIKENLNGFEFREAYMLAEGSHSIYEVEFDNDLEEIKLEFDNKGKLMVKDQNQIERD